ncbi:choice-of-anchor Q domain-containing protein [Spirosoma migulaei]
MKIFFLFFSSLLISFATHSQPIVHVTPSGAGDKSGTSWSNAIPGTQLPNQVATASAGTQFWVAAGTYKPTTTTDRSPFQIASGVQLYGGFSGSETSLSSRRLTQPSSTTLSGDIGILNNTSDNSISVVEFVQVSENTRLDGVVITGGNAKETFPYGGGISNRSFPNLPANNYSAPTISNCTITGNSAYFGGGIFSATFTDNSKSPSIINCIIENNTAEYGGGGVALIRGNLAMVNTKIVNNTGGGFVNGLDGYDGNPTLVNCLIAGNSSLSGGGIVDNNGHMVLTNCSIVNNHAQLYGGGIVSDTSAARATPHLLLTNCFIWGNTALYDRGIQTNIRHFSVTYSIIQDGYPGIGNLTTDPLFVDRINYDFRLNPNSPAINAGDPTSTGLPITDLAGLPRIQGGRVDIGAYEFTSCFGFPCLPFFVEKKK